ncbi:hypothetical protein O0L34_g11030 [Tuta absoluta]|nr:hypothetical protein O0L34_g11030 [Tuta absoluta]
MSFSSHSITEADDLAKKQQEAVYIELAAAAAGSGDFHRAQQILRIAENLYSTPLGKKILKSAQKAKRKQSTKSPGSSGSDASEEASEEDSEPSDDEEEGKEEEDSDSSEESLHINLKSFEEACMLLEEAEKYFAQREIELNKPKSEVQLKPEIKLPFADKRSWKSSNENLRKGKRKDT